MIAFYDRDGAPIQRDAWANLFEHDLDRRRVALTELPNGITVSTIWLGIDARLVAHAGPPLIFESQVFGGPYDLFGRYATEAEALAGHERLIASLESYETSSPR